MPNYVYIKIRRDTALNWSSNNPTLKLGEIGYDMTNKRLKVGDGTTSWNSLSFIMPEIINDLTSGGSDKALSAEQGKTLKEKISDLEDSVSEIIETGGVPVVNNLTSTSTTSALSANMGRQLKSEIDAVTASGGTPVDDNLTSTSTTHALSANQGRVLNGKIASVESKVDNVGIFGMGYSIDEFNNYSKPTKITFEDGVTATLSWTAGTQLRKITASTGEVMTIDYDDDGRIIGRSVTRG